MFYVDHGTLLDGKILDAKIYQYVSLHDTLSTLKMSIEDSEWMRDSCHPNGYFRCNRCYRKHFIVNNFDLQYNGYYINRAKRQARFNTISKRVYT